MKCNCECHKSKVELLHLFPCCHRCPYCGERITVESYNEHLEICKFVFLDVPKKNNYLIVRDD